MFWTQLFLALDSGLEPLFLPIPVLLKLLTLVLRSKSLLLFALLVFLLILFGQQLGFGHVLEETVMDGVAVIHLRSARAGAS